MILVVDDIESDRRWIGAVLESAGYHVSYAADGNQALELLRRQHVQAAVIDIFMPEKEGLETIREIKRDWPDLAVVAVTAGGRAANTGILNAARAFGAAAALIKPIRRESMLETLANALAAPKENGA